jgi:hypothetical protein
MFTDEPLKGESDPLESRYANYFAIGFNEQEVIIECGQYYAGDSKPLIHTRLVTTPTYAAALLELLRTTSTQHRFHHDEPIQD